MRYRLSTVFLVITLLSVLLAWYVEHHRRYYDHFVGVWYFPTSENRVAGVWETLTIRRDRTFTKIQKHRLLSETYSGTYTVAENGLVTFHVTSKDFDDHSIPTKIDTYRVDASFRCWLATDSHSNLIVADLDNRPSTDVKIAMSENVDIRWRGCYTTVSHEAQRDAMQKRLTELILKLEREEKQKAGSEIPESE